MSSVPSTVDDFQAFQEFLKRMAEMLAIPLELVQEKSYKLFDILQPSTQNKVSLPFKEGILEPAKELWATSPLCSQHLNEQIENIQFPHRGLRIFILTQLHLQS